MKKLWPDAKLAIGPAIDNGFYYDFDMEHKLNRSGSSEDPEGNEEGDPGQSIRWNSFELPRRRSASSSWLDKHEDYKVELIRRPARGRGHLHVSRREIL